MTTRLATTAAALLLGALVGAGGCVDNRASIQVQMICQPTPSCTFSAGCDTQYVGYPTYDRSLATTGVLTLFVQVANQLPNNEDLEVGRVNNNNAHVDEIYSTLEGVVNSEQTVGANGEIAAGGVGVIGVPFLVPAIPTGGTAVDGEAVARMRLRGYYDHGERFETGEFPVTIKVCSGCLTALCAGATKICPAEGQRPLACGT